MGKITAVRTIMPAELNTLLGTRRGFWSYLYKEGLVDKVVPLEEAGDTVNTSPLIVNSRLLYQLEYRLPKKRKGRFIIRNQRYAKEWLRVQREGLAMEAQGHRAEPSKPATLFDMQAQAQWEHVLQHVKTFESIYAAVQTEHNKIDQRLSSLEGNLEALSEALKDAIHSLVERQKLLERSKLTPKLRELIEVYFQDGQEETAWAILEAMRV